MLLVHEVPLSKIQYTGRMWLYILAPIINCFIHLRTGSFQLFGPRPSDVVHAPRLDFDPETTLDR